MVMGIIQTDRTNCAANQFIQLYLTSIFHEWELGTVFSLTEENNQLYS